MNKPKSNEVEIKGNKLICPICKHTFFWTKKTLMNTARLTFWNMEYLNKQAVNYICDSCGYVIWFLDKI